MAEIELKLQVPPASLAAVKRALQRGRTARLHLRALYFDTPERRLAQAGLALRLRREGRQWVQTLKCGAEGAVARLEHEVVLAATAHAPTIDITRHAGTPEGRMLAEALDGHAQTLALCFETDIWRTRRVLHRGGARIELALDQGRLRAGAATLPVCEIEFELLRGTIHDLTEVVAPWVQRHGLWLDVRSKAERGHLLAAGLNTAPALKSVTPELTAKATPDDALRRCLRAALQQVLVNGSWLAAGQAQAEHLHQARVGLRRLMSLLRDFGDWSVDVDAGWLDAAKHAFDRLAAARDRDALSSWLLPALREAGVEWPSIAGSAIRAASTRLAAQHPGAVFLDADTNSWLLEMIAFVHGSATVAGPGGKLRALARLPLARLHRQVHRAGADYTKLDDDARHRVRKRLKRLRYGADSLAALWPAKPWARYAVRLNEGQEVLGQLQDIVVAAALLRESQAMDGRAVVALEALQRLQSRLVADASRVLRRLGKLPVFLR